MMRIFKAKLNFLWSSKDKIKAKRSERKSCQTNSQLWRDYATQLIFCVRSNLVFMRFKWQWSVNIFPKGVNNSQMSCAAQIHFFSFPLFFATVVTSSQLCPFCITLWYSVLMMVSLRNDSISHRLNPRNGMKNHVKRMRQKTSIVAELE